jgi:hypothetical protein
LVHEVIPVPPPAVGKVPACNNPPLPV